MKNEEITDHLQRMEGQVGLLMAALQGLILVQPDPIEAAKFVSQRVEKFLSSALGSKKPDAYVEGIQLLQQQLFPKPDTLR